MKGDFSRNTHRPASQYSRVLMQQGRVQIDADWNEQTSILLDYMRALTRDLFGDHAGPAEDCGFRVVTSADKASMTAPEIALLKKDNDVQIRRGRYYAGGIPVENAEVMRYDEQLGASLEDALPENLLQRSWLAYLDVWEDYVSADQDARIREVALGRADTCGRARVNWRVRVMIDPEADNPLAALERQSLALIKVEARKTEAEESLCSIDPDARYRGPENQLYRIEIQNGSEGANPPTFKWSRDNGAITFPVIQSTGSTLKLAHLGRDEATGLAVGDWVELIDDARLAAFGVGQMAQVSAVDPHEHVVDLKLPEPTSSLRNYSEAEAAQLHAILRRWDHRGDAAEKGKGVIVAKPGLEIELEDGIIAIFKAGDFRPGDYWYIPARVLTGDVEWESLPGAGGFRPPDGPHHVYAPLALGKAGGGVEDLRCRIARLPCVAAAPAAEAVEVGDIVRDVAKPPSTRKGRTKDDG